MEKSSFVLKLIRIVFILGLIGLFVSLINILCVFFGHNLNWEMARKFHSSIDFTKIWKNDENAFNVISLIEIVTVILKIYIFLNVLKVFKNLNFNEPFNQKINDIIRKIIYFSISIGILGVLIKVYIELFVANDLLLSTQIGNSEYLWIGALLFILNKIFIKGYELQSENDLTI